MAHFSVKERPKHDAIQKGIFSEDSGKASIYLRSQIWQSMYVIVISPGNGSPCSWKAGIFTRPPSSPGSPILHILPTGV